MAKAQELETYVIDTLIRRRRYVGARTKSQAEALAGSIIDRGVESLEPPYLVEGTETVAGVYLLSEMEEDE